MSNNTLTSTAEWTALKAHQEEMQNVHMRDLFAKNPERFETFHMKHSGLLFDFSKNLITDETIELLINLAKACDLENQRGRMFSGELINESENRAALHCALRGSTETGLTIDGENVRVFVDQTLERVKALSEEIRANKNITDVVCLGIGGSDVGPHMACQSLKPFADGPRIHFVSNIDGAHLTQTLDRFQSQSTLFIIASKTFTTLETMSNAEEAKNWAQGQSFFIAITSNEEAAQSFGISAEDILPMRNWIGGRYSLWSAIGLPIAIACGFDQFEELLRGAKDADTHFKTAPLNQNIPVIMGLLSIWHRNFWDYRTQAILPYAQNLERLPAYIQQLEMESNGKNVDQSGQKIDYATSLVIFGETGTKAQHAFLQMLHQGTDIIPADFILIAQPEHNLNEHHKKLLANALAQSRALMHGDENTAEPHKNFPGNRPSSTIILDRLDAYHFGMLLAFYEHKTFVQGCVWNINSFDQWGVELGKIIAHDILESLNKNDAYKESDSSTAALLKYIQGVNSTHG